MSENKFDVSKRVDTVPSSSIMYRMLLVCVIFSCYQITNTYGLLSNDSCSKAVNKYNEASCKIYWNCTIEKLLRPYKYIRRDFFSNLQPKDVGHTPLWLRISRKKLYCVLHPNISVQRQSLRLKPYRALHYINRINGILKSSSTFIPDETEWWSHQSDWAKVPEGEDVPPVFSISGAKGYADLAGIPFMSFTDRLAQRENKAFQYYDQQFDSEISFNKRWQKKKNILYFRGGLTDCEMAAKYHNGDVRYCGRAKIILEKVRSKNSFLDGVSSNSRFRDVGLREECDECFQPRLRGFDFVEELVSHKYLLNFPGAGNWSRRMALLLRSGGVVFQAESEGYQFYELNLKPGLHFIPFNIDLGSIGAGNLISRVQWAEENEEVARQIAFRSGTFSKYCLKENSINYFIEVLLQEYSKLLIGSSVKLPMVDLSSCLAGPNEKSIARMCQETIHKCWK